MKLLFQGDSVTAGGRDYSNPADPGQGYVGMLAKALPGTTVINRGIGGDRTAQLDARWENDCIALHPDVTTLLIGINDVWRHFDADLKLDLKIFGQTYERLIERTLPITGSIILMEPFLIPSVAEKLRMRPLLDDTIQVIRSAAKRHGLPCIPLDDLFAAACLTNPPAYWAEDGVHPSAAGHRLIADAWLNAFPNLTES